MPNLSQYRELERKLGEFGHNEADVARMMLELVRYDKRTISDSIFAALDDGSFVLDSEREPA